MIDSVEFMAYAVGYSNGELAIEEVKAETRNGQTLIEGSVQWANHPQDQVFNGVGISLTGFLVVSSTRKGASGFLVQELKGQLAKAKSDMEASRLRASKLRRLIKEAKTNG